MDFQETVQDLIQLTNDAHTRYQKPVCYNAIFLQPFAFDLRIVQGADGSVQEEPKAFLMANTYTNAYLQIFPDSPINSLFGQEVTLLNDLEFTTEVTSWADARETRSNNRGVRFNTAIRSYLYRSAIQYNVRPLTDLKVTLVDGRSFVFPWLASYTGGFANTSFCAAVATGADTSSMLTMNTPHSKHHFPFVNRTHHPELLDPPTPLVSTVLEQSSTSDRTIIVPADTPYFVSCFTQHVTNSTQVSDVLVMKISSFSPSGTDGIKGFFANAEKCLTSNYDLVVIDVMQNGGGIVCLGLRMLELLIEDYNKDHSLVQMNYDLPHSPLMDTYIKVVNSNEGYINKATGEPYPDGAAYYYGRNVTMGGVQHQRTNYFSLDCSDFEKLPFGFKPKKFMTPDRLIFITDGTCGSTCACFTKIPQEHKKVTIVGAGGLWEEGMDISSFAGGFVSNPDTMSSIAEESGLSFPKFLTNQRWQFDWAIWYSELFPTRPAQFVENEPDFREPFWGFPHPSVDVSVTTAMVSNLYDNVINAAVARFN